MNYRLQRKEIDLKRIRTIVILIGIAGSLMCLNGCGSREIPTEAAVESITPIESITPMESIIPTESTRCV